ncbi:small multi-drug export protein [Alicyclobacillus sp. ALC3]|uniref:small multi-drug export protein n=1 Tax=Alicyclobacillus sp. ALC3 TaxID=2796143 RepID=UPI002378F712|nr:small multi-drug export protein [Alicyclobacillus sp. ALC3]WDL95553.1 small multi-drug export protein [Alicyclobacillus sp. ALC3]
MEDADNIHAGAHRERGSGPGNFRQVLGLSVVLGLVFFVAAWWIGIADGAPMRALSLIGVSIVLEAQPAAVASLALGFHPIPGAVISILANLILIPLMVFGYAQIIARWHWLQKRLEKANKWAAKYGRYGVWVLLPLTPLIGAYMCIAFAHILRWPTGRSLVSTTLGVIWSTLLITLGGHWVLHAFTWWTHWKL